MVNILKRTKSALYKMGKIRLIAEFKTEIEVRDRKLAGKEDLLFKKDLEIRELNGQLRSSIEQLASADSSLQIDRTKVRNTLTAVESMAAVKYPGVLFGKKKHDNFGNILIPGEHVEFKGKEPERLTSLRHIHSLLTGVL